MGLPDEGWNVTSRDAISNELINCLIMRHVSITDNVHAFHSGNHTNVHNEFVFSIDTFQNSHFLTSGLAMVSFAFRTFSERNAFKVEVIELVSFLRYPYTMFHEGSCFFQFE